METMDSGRYDPWSDFVDNTTLHGLRYVFRKKFTTLRVVWFFTLIGAASFLIFIVAGSINKYFKYPISTVIEQRYPTSLKFPAVTICPQNMFMKSKMTMPDMDPKFRKLSLNMSACDATAAVRAGRPCGLAMLCCCGLVMSENLMFSTVPGCTPQYKTQLVKALKSSGIIFNTREFFRLYSPDIENILGPVCEFGLRNGDFCTEKDFGSLRITSTGKCFTFNSGDNLPIRSVGDAGSSKGLTVVLDSQIAENTVGKATPGFQIFVHEQDEFFNSLDGILVGPGTQVAVSFSKKQFINLPSPYPTKCENKTLTTSPVYTVDGCLHECLLTEVEKKCGCHLVSYQGTRRFRYCDSSDTECRTSVPRQVNAQTCHCPTPCEYVHYDTHVSYSTGFPEPWISALMNSTGYNKSLEYQRANLVFVQVGFKSLSYERQEQVASFDTWALLGDMGGTMGLLIGSSVITMFEFIDCLAVAFLQRCRTQRRKQQTCKVSPCEINHDEIPGDDLIPNTAQEKKPDLHVTSAHVI